MKLSAEYFENALKILNINLPPKKTGVYLGILKESFIQFLHTLFPKVFVSKEYKEDPVKTFLVRTHMRLAAIYYFSDIPKTFYLFLNSLNNSEK